MLEHEQWLKFAFDDLKVAETILQSDYIVIGAICYHAQQCAEKALKGYLVYQKIKPRRTHDLSELTLECAEFNEAFLSILPDALEISPYSHKTRYPDSAIMLDISTAQDAIIRAQKILQCVQHNISRNCSY